MEHDEDEALKDLLQDPGQRQNSDRYTPPLAFTETDNSKTGKLSRFKITLMIISIISVLWAVYRIKCYLDPFELAAEATLWPTTMGTVLSANSCTFNYSSSDRTHRNVDLSMYKPVITYSYKIGNADFSSSQFSIATRANYGGWSQPNIPDEIVKRYPAGAAIKVHYNPADPKMAVIQPGFEPEYFSLWPGDVIAIMFALWLPLYWIITERFGPRYNYENQLVKYNYNQIDGPSLLWNVIFLVFPCFCISLFLSAGIAKFLPKYGVVYLDGKYCPQLNHANNDEEKMQQTHKGLRQAN